MVDALDDPRTVASLIDHTLLKPEATQNDVARACEEGLRYAFCSVCINPHWVKFAATALAGSPVRVCTVVGFPFGASATGTKLAEAEIGLSEGAQELDMVQNVGALRSGDFQTVRKEIAEIAKLAHSHGAILKVILETCLLTDDEKVAACRLAADAKADFVKTSTGFSTAGATIEDIKLMRQTVGKELGVKASGGVRTIDALCQMVAAGATRIGTSSGVSILNEMAGRKEATPEAKIYQNY